jgi:molecular chaperone HscB
LKIDSDDFELFGLPRRFAMERRELDERWRAVQTKVHPDRFAVEGAAAQRVAMQWAMRVNEAYRRLKDPVERATQLCQLAGVVIDRHDNAAMPREFLMQQMQWREALEEAADVVAVHALQADVEQHRKRLLDDLRVDLDVRSDAVAAAASVRSLMFVDRFLDDLHRRLEALGA